MSAPNYGFPQGLRCKLNNTLPHQFPHKAGSASTAEGLGFEWKNSCPASTRTDQPQRETAINSGHKKSR